MSRSQKIVPEDITIACVQDIQRSIDIPDKHEAIGRLRQLLDKGRSLVAPEILAIAAAPGINDEFVWAKEEYSLTYKSA